ncbi:Polypeptide-transport-associated domain protein FtsQ-type [Desulfonatronospira thiodismutans ASO3-1]|uniref:Polypeptide-transport-associated domain protein FtsQ-type n=1 Tax=Desulfonatronospira thiodismutans ASO3-1 TaxID=555779 RepID=D6SUI4_9BACT|nr:MULTISPECIES: FtsQ-type POTRA domain-containing protein [Desulfonatronospira]EFI32964.1 Polypeptide-transport-associated domain protein FtsQ-type [Desulfonatronospira thiodismutans ASO3-1]
MTARRTRTRRNTGSQHSPRPVGVLRRFFSAVTGLLGLVLVLCLSLGILVLVSAALIHGYRYATSSEYLALQEIEIKGNQRLTYAEVLRLMQVDTGENMLKLNISRMQKNLADSPWIKQARVRRDFPDQLHVDIQEKQAYFWVQNDHNLYYADKKGRTIDRLSPERLVSLPVLHLHDGAGSRHVAEIVTTLERRRFPFSIQDISWIRITETGRAHMYIHGLDLELSLDCRELEPQTDKLNLVWNDLRRRQDIDAVKRITVAGENAWVAYRRQAKPENQGK